MEYFLINEKMIRDTKLDFALYRDRLKVLYPQYSEEQLMEIFVLRVEFWKVVVENTKCIYKK